MIVDKKNFICNITIGNTHITINKRKFIIFVINVSAIFIAYWINSII